MKEYSNLTVILGDSPYLRLWSIGGNIPGTIPYARVRNNSRKAKGSCGTASPAGNATCLHEEGPTPIIVPKGALGGTIVGYGVL